MTNLLQVSTTFSRRSDALRIARTLVEQRLAACAQIVGPITSIYWWQGRRYRSREWLCLLKTRTSLYPRLQQKLLRLHPYETPEIVATRVVTGNPDYLDWIRRETTG
ncbi:MAG: divalent-cation tolerance protein CutA [candidate division WOR-3 bacterium]